MCTAATYQTKDHYFGRNLDYEFSYGENAVIIPRNFPFTFREVGTLASHYAIMGIAYLAPEPSNSATNTSQNPATNTDHASSYPLLYDAINEKGLGIAGLNFVGNTVYHDHADGRDNIAQFELLPWLLGRCANVAEAKTLLERINLRSFGFSPELPPSELHWILSDTTGACIVVESVADGLKTYDNPAGVLTNNPPFDEQLFSLNNYMTLSPKDPENHFAPALPLKEYSRGMGAIGLPGDLSSNSRFVKVAFTRAHSRNKPSETPANANLAQAPANTNPDQTEASTNPDQTATNPAQESSDELASISQFFHILHSVEQQYGCCDLGDNKYEHTIYSSGYNLDQGIFYYTTYNNHQISAIKLSSANLDADQLVIYPVLETEQIHYQN